MISDKSLINFKLLSNTYTIIFLALIVRIIVSFSLIGGLHADEEFQGIEMAYNLVFPASTNIVPWEFTTQTRSYLVPLLFIPIIYLSLFSQLRGIILFQTVRFCFSLLSLIFIPFSRTIFDNNTKNGQVSSIIVSYFFAFYLPLIFFSNYLGADGFGLLLTVLLLFYVSKKNAIDHSSYKFFIIGFLIGFIIALRLQFTIVFIFFLANSFLKRKMTVISGFLIGILPLFIIDYIFYGFPGISIINFFRFNVLDQKNISLVSINYWWLYLLIVPILLLYVGLGFPIIIFNYKTNKFYGENHILRSFAFGSLVYITFFQILTYKEIRFLITPIIIIIFESLQSLPNFLSYLVRFKKRKLVKLYAIILIFSIPLSMLIAPYNYDLKDNLWLAQDYTRRIDLNATIGILDPFQLSGGYFLQYGHPTEGKIYFLDGLSTNKLNSTLSIISYLILDLNHPFYQEVSNLKNSSCNSNILIKNFFYLNSFSVDYLNYQLNPNKLGMMIELWKCN